MDAIQRIQEIFQQAESLLTALAADCLARRDFDGASAAIEAARQLDGSQNDSKPLAPSDAELTAIQSGGDTNARRLASAPQIARTVRPKKGDYPKFLRESSSLIKIGWSKSEKAEYEHKSPRKVLAYLVPAIAKIGAGGKRFAMDRVLPLKDSEGVQIPDYQAYLCLGWLRSIGAVEQHGRQGYSLPKKTDLTVVAEASWEKLPSR